MLSFSNSSPAENSEVTSTSAPSIESKPDSSVKSTPGDNQNELERIDLKFDRNSDDSRTTTDKSSTNNNKHSPTANPSPGAFSLKNPVSSFRSWVSNKKSSKEEPTPNESATSASSSYRKIDTSPTTRKVSIDGDATKRNRTNSASIPTSNSHQQAETSAGSPVNAARVKKKSSFSLRSTNPISLLKRTAETSNTNEADLPSTEPTGGAGGSGGPFGYLKNLVRGEKQ